ncbi:hypothetical protein FRB99_006193 [Tulasnella sp. 403]|nr:hypothetical protein FRB99_006193 [Tulasnella sp. 403]
MSVPDPFYQGRRLILCFDGSGDSYDDDNTNIVRFFTALEKNCTDKQLCYYQPGIGTYVAPNAAWSSISKKVAETIDFALAWYLDAHIMGGYRFLMQNYTKGDKICIFGFSRGAYTARCLAGMLHKVGLLPKSNEEQISFAYEKYKDNSEQGLIRAFGFKSAFSKSVDIEFMGVWDTVSSVGFTGRHLPFTSSNTIIKTFRHALSLDERRAKFKPNPWHNPAPTASAAKNDPECGTAVAKPPEVAGSVFQRFLKSLGTYKPNVTLYNKDGTERDLDDDYRTEETDVKEVWFAGCHTDVGGGSVENTVQTSLANPTLAWMLNELVQANVDILFKDNAFADIPSIEVLTATSPISPSHFPAASEATYVSPSGHVKDNTATTGGHKSQATEGGQTIISVQDDALVQDSTSKIHDALAGFSFWWLLEVVPMRQHYQDSRGKWHKRWSFNCGRGRTIQQGNPLFHSSVKIREQADHKYKPKAKWMGDVTYVD